MKDNLVLTEEHNEVIEAFVEFLHNEDRFFYLDGGSGCGKTTLVKHLIDNTIKEYNSAAELLGLEKKEEVYVTAMHNKAVAVLNESGLEANTIHSHLGMVLSFVGGKYKLLPKRPIKGGDSQILIIDECSTMDSVIYNRLMLLPKAKIVLVGDRYQAPPVGVEESVIYAHSNKVHTLREVMRTDIPLFKEIYMEMRSQVEHKEQSVIPLAKGLIERISYEDAHDKMLDTLKDGNESIAYLGYTNKTVQYANLAVRRYLGNGDLPEVGDLMTINTAVATVGEDKIIPTDTRAVVTSIWEDSLLDYGGIEAQTYTVSVELLKGPKHNIRYADPNILRAWIKKAQKSKDWRMLFYFKEHIADLRYTYAMTVHKAQGSTYDQVIVDLSDLSSCTNTSLARKLIYVAVTRARKKVWLVGELKERIGVLKDVTSLDSAGPVHVDGSMD